MAVDCPYGTDWCVAYTGGHVVNASSNKKERVSAPGIAINSFICSLKL